MSIDNVNKFVRLFLVSGHGHINCLVVINKALRKKFRFENLLFTFMELSLLIEPLRTVTSIATATTSFQFFQSTMFLSDSLFMAIDFFFVCDSLYFVFLNNSHTHFSRLSSSVVFGIEQQWKRES